MSEKATRELSPDDAADVVNRLTNMRYNPVVSTEEVADELGAESAVVERLLDEHPAPESKPIGETRVWWW